MVAVAMPPRADQRDLAEFAFVDQFVFSLDVMLAAALLQANLQDTICRLDSLDDLVALINREGERFLDVDVFAGSAGIDRHGLVPWIWSSDQHSIDILR